MKTAVRYYSRGGNTKLLADSIARGICDNAYSILDNKSEIDKKVDLLFIGGALYAYGIDKELRNYILNLDAGKIKKAVIFSTSWVSKHAIFIMKKLLLGKGIDVDEDYFYVRNKPSKNDLKRAEEFSKKMMR